MNAYVANPSSSSSLHPNTNPNPHAGLGILYSPLSPLLHSYTTATFIDHLPYPIPSSTPSTPPPTPKITMACASKDFMNFTTSFVIQLSRNTPVKKIQHGIPTDMFSFVNHVLTTTQVSLSIVILALGILQKFQQKVSLVMKETEGCSPSTFLLDEKSFPSLHEMDVPVLLRLRNKVNAKTLFVAALMLAMKSPNGCCNSYTNLTWSQVAMIPNSVLSSVELDVTLFLGCDIWMKEPEYIQWVNKIRLVAEEYMAKVYHTQLAVAAAQRQQLLLLSKPSMLAMSMSPPESMFKALSPISPPMCRTFQLSHQLQVPMQSNRPRSAPSMKGRRARAFPYSR